MAEVVLRPEVGQANVDSLRDAYGTLQHLSPTDNRSWIYWASYHGFDRYDCWHHNAVGPGRGTEFAYDLFLPWHRAYLVNFDHVTREQNRKAILPWWDWTSEVSHQAGVPESYTGGDDNPLASGPTPDMPGAPAHRTRRFPGDPSQLPFMDRPDPVPGSPEPIPAINDLIELPQYEDFSSQVQDVHDFMHGWTGGRNATNPRESGDMGVIGTAAFDPIFWAHHAMIDRLWYLWQLQNGINNIPDDYKDKVLAPFQFRVRDVLDIRQLGYEYAVASTASVALNVHGGS